MIANRDPDIVLPFDNLIELVCVLCRERTERFENLVVWWPNHEGELLLQEYTQPASRAKPRMAYVKKTA